MRSAVLLVALAAAPAAAQGITAEIVASGLTRPVYVTHAPGDDARIFVIEKQGRIRIVDLATGTVAATPFLDVDTITAGGTSNFSEQGLLGLAFHPDYQSNGRLFINHTNLSSDTRVVEYTADGDPATATTADATTARTILAIDQPQTNHNGGWIEFGSDGYLYIASGDGGGSDDQGTGHNNLIGNGQDLETLLGKMLRIDVSDTAMPYEIPASNPFLGDANALDEIWAYGLRNPWRPSFDRATGDLYIADVGQDFWEEVNVQPASSEGGENYGWRCREGAHDFNTSNCPGISAFVDPVIEYGHGSGCSITGGYVYRGCAMPDMVGRYFFADYCAGTIWSMVWDGTTATDLRDHTAEINATASINAITSFGEDAAGELYICDQGGEVYRIVPTNPIDTDGDGTPDSCEPCPVDINGDGTLDFFDVSAFLTAYAAGDLSVDFNGDGVLDFFDVSDFLTLYGQGCP